MASSYGLTPQRHLHRVDSYLDIGRLMQPTENASGNEGAPVPSVTAHDLLSVFALPTVAVDSDMHCQALQDTLDPVFDEILRVRDGRALIISPVVSDQFVTLLNQLARQGPGDSWISTVLSVQRASGRPFVVRMVASSDGRDKPRVLIAILDLDARRAVSLDLLRNVFSLTRAEARLAALLFEGLSVHEVAERLGTKISTLRTQLSEVFAKTDTRRQAELVDLIGRLQIIG